MHSTSRIGFTGIASPIDRLLPIRVNSELPVRSVPERVQCLKPTLTGTLRSVGKLACRLTRPDSVVRS